MLFRVQAVRGVVGRPNFGFEIKISMGVVFEATGFGNGKATPLLRMCCLPRNEEKA